MEAQDIRCTVSESSLEDWWVIERAEHDGRSWIEQIGHGMSACMRSSRLEPMTDIEGSADEMHEIAGAIERRGSAHFKRCSAEWTADGVLFMSPRNSEEPVLVTHARALELASEIRKKVPRT